MRTVTIIIESHNGIAFRAFVLGEGNWVTGKSPEEALGGRLMGMAKDGAFTVDRIVPVYANPENANATSIAITKKIPYDLAEWR